MSTAIIGAGNIGSAVATHLTQGGEHVVVSAQGESSAEQLASRLGSLATSARVAEAIDQAETVIFAVWFDTIKELVSRHGDRLAGKVVIDPSNPVAMAADGTFARTLPDGVSAASVIAGLLPSEAHFVKAFGTLAAPKLAEAANRSPDLAVLFYATDDAAAGSEATRLISAAGFAPVNVGGLDQAIRIEMFGDLHDFGGLDGRLVTVAEAEALLAASAA